MNKKLPILAIITAVFFLSVAGVFADHTEKHTRRQAKRIATAQPTSTPTRVPTKTLTKTPTPTKKNTPTPTIKIATPTVKPTTNSTDERYIYIMNAINDYRSSHDLSPVKENDLTCDFAHVRAKEISESFNHDGFRSRIDSKTLPYPGYSRISENIARTSDYKQVVDLWINSSGHAANMRLDTPYVCVRSLGDYYAYEGWKPK